MELFDGIINDIVDKLSSDTRLSQIDFASAFRTTRKTNPLLKTLVTVGINGVELSERAIGQYLGIQDDNEVYGKNANVRLLLRIHCPINQGGQKCAEIFSMICNTLIFDNVGYKVLEFNCKDIGFDNPSSCFILDCLLKVNSFVTEIPKQLAISNIKVEGEI